MSQMLTIKLWTRKGNNLYWKDNFLLNNETRGVGRPMVAWAVRTFLVSIRQNKSDYCIDKVNQKKYKIQLMIHLIV